MLCDKETLKPCLVKMANGKSLFLFSSLPFIKQNFLGHVIFCHIQHFFGHNIKLEDELKYHSKTQASIISEASMDSLVTLPCHVKLKCVNFLSFRIMSCGPNKTNCHAKTSPQDGSKLFWDTMSVLSVKPGVSPVFVIFLGPCSSSGRLFAAVHYGGRDLFTDVFFMQ